MSQPSKPEHPFISLVFNIVIPVLILNKGHSVFGIEFSATTVLLVALALPVSYGAWDWYQNKRKNLVAAFGIINVLFTGGLALLKVKGIWFAVKEAGFPFLIGVFVLISAYIKKPFFERLVTHSPLLNWQLIESKITQAQNTLMLKNKLKMLFIKATILFSYSFFISAVLNFILAIYIFTDSPPDVSSAESNIILNKKIADMTWLGFVVIGLPLTVFTMGIFWWFLKKLSYITGLSIEQLLPKSDTPAKPPKTC